MTFDLIIVGAGPAGCSAAITASHNGATVLLLERGRLPRHRVCGEFVSAESLDLLHDLLVLDQRHVVTAAVRIDRTRIFADGATLEADIDPAAASIARYDLDYALWQSCSQSKVETREDCTVQSVERVNSTGPFKVAVRHETFHAKAVINATGRWSNLTSQQTRAASLRQKERWIGVKAHFQENIAENINSTHSNTRGSVDLYFFKGGYCGVQPVDLASQTRTCARINVCAMVRANAATTLTDVLRCHPALQERSRIWRPLMDAVTTSPLIFHDPQPVLDGMLQAGDSATFVDPFIGDGISLALRSGALAAECLLPFFRGDCSLDQSAAQYSSSYKRSLAPVFRASSRLRHLLRWPEMIRKPALSLLEKTPSITRRLVKMTR